MTSLRQFLSHLRPGAGPAHGPVRKERRLAERRTGVLALRDRETRLRFAAQAAGLGIYDVDFATGEIHWSPEMRAIAGLPREDTPISVQDIARIVHPDDRERVMAKIAAATDPKIAADFEDEHRLVRPDGTLRWVRAKGRTFFAGDNGECRPVGCAGVVIDITESRTYQEALAESRARLAALIDSSTDAILSIDTDQRIVLVNPAACRMFRCRAEDVIGTPHDRFIPERFRETHRQHVQRFLEKGVSSRAMGQAGTFLGLRSDGEEFPIEASIAKTRVGGQWQMTVIIRDVTERKAAEEALRRSREELAMAVRGADIGTWNWDMRTGDMVWSERCRQLFGIPLDEPMTFQLFLGALHPDDRTMAEKAVSRALEEHQEYNLELRVLWPDGSGHWVAVVGRGHYDGESGEVIGMSGIALDISQRKEAEEALREREELMRLTNAAADIGTYDTNLETGRVRLSPELCDILGLDPCSEMDWQQAFGLIHEADRDEIRAALDRSMDPSSDGLVHSEHRVVRPDGQIRWLVWRGRTLFRDTPGGKEPVRNIGACFDITERKRLEEALQRANDELERRVEERTAQLSGANDELVRSNLELQQFTYVAAHDLQTPLRSISGFAQLLQKEFRGRLNDQADVWIGQLVHHVERMHELIQDLLIYSGVDSPSRPFGITDFRLIFDDAVASLQKAIAENGATITRGDLPVVMGDRIQLAQVLQNLIDNGIKYRGDKPPQIHVSARRLGNEWVFAVRDNGIGIARKHHQRIFDIFKRLHSQQAYPGTGIGLAVCRRVIQRHGGRIWVESEPNQGATFYFTLPADLSSPSPAEQEAND
ncbi:MAG: PAS domain S-box protein [Actinomycetota bacterium]